MNNITEKMLETLIENPRSDRQPFTPKMKMTPAIDIAGTTIKSPINAMTLALMGRFASPAESPAEITKLENALATLTSDVGYGSGRFYDSMGNPESDYWLAAIWAIASLNWSSGKDIARNWSEQSSRYTEAGFEKTWGSYNPAHPNGIGIGSLYKRAIESGLNQTVIEHQGHNSQLVEPKKYFTLLGIDDLIALPPTEHLVKGILPSSGLAAIYGPSGSGKTFLALDLIMAIACQPDWFGHKINNAPVTYVGLEGKGGISNRIQAWRAKHPTLRPENFKIILDNFDLTKQANVEELAQAIIKANMHAGVIVIDTLNQASPGADENSSQDMGTIIKHLKLLQEMTGGLVIIIHHTGKNTAQGLRGHSSLKAALDANIEVTGGLKRSWLLEKSKDGEDGKSFAFRLEGQRLGIDSDGDPITSCTVERDHSALFVKPEPSGTQQKLALNAIKEVLANLTSKEIKVEVAITTIARKLTTVPPNKRSNRARALLDNLIDKGYLSSKLINDEGWVCLG